ncbi:hypothetical protein BH10PLA2_BH10PLA2_06670 [soil metagenome]
MRSTYLVRIVSLLFLAVPAGCKDKAQPASTPTSVSVPTPNGATDIAQPAAEPAAPIPTHHWWTGSAGAAEFVFHWPLDPLSTPELFLTSSTVPQHDERNPFARPQPTAVHYLMGEAKATKRTDTGFMVTRFLSIYHEVSPELSLARRPWKCESTTDYNVTVTFGKEATVVLSIKSGDQRNSRKGTAKRWAATDVEVERWVKSARERFIDPSKRYEKPDSESDKVRYQLGVHRVDDRVIDELLAPGGPFDRVFKDPDWFKNDGYGSKEHLRKVLLDDLVSVCGLAERLSKAPTPAEKETGKALRDIVFVAPLDLQIISVGKALGPKVLNRNRNPVKSKTKIGPFGEVVWEDPDPSSTLRGLALVLLVVDYSKNVEGGRTKLEDLCRKVLPDGEGQTAAVESLASRIRSAEKAVFVPYHLHLKEGYFKSEKWAVEATSFDSILRGVATELSAAVETDLSAPPKYYRRRTNLNRVVEEVAAARTAAALAEMAAARSLTAEQTVTLTASAFEYKDANQRFEIAPVNLMRLHSVEADRWAGVSLVMSLSDRKPVEQKVVDRLRAQKGDGKSRKLSLPTERFGPDESAIYRRLMPDK